MCQYEFFFFGAQVTKKLGGKATGTATWVTNVGNEHGQVLMSVLTDSEGDGLNSMAEGLMHQFILGRLTLHHRKSYMLTRIAAHRETPPMGQHRN